MRRNGGGVYNNPVRWCKTLKKLTPELGRKFEDEYEVLIPNAKDIYYDFDGKILTFVYYTPSHGILMKKDLVVYAINVKDRVTNIVYHHFRKNTQFDGKLYKKIEVVKNSVRFPGLAGEEKIKKNTLLKIIYTKNFISKYEPTAESVTYYGLPIGGEHYNLEVPAHYTGPNITTFSSLLEIPPTIKAEKAEEKTNKTFKKLAEKSCQSIITYGSPNGLLHLCVRNGLVFAGIGDEVYYTANKSVLGLANHFERILRGSPAKSITLHEFEGLSTLTDEEFDLFLKLY